jgi:hypothetical protein
LNYFDCDAAYGRGALALPKEIETVDALLAEMDHCGIQKALVWHRDSWERDFDAGNRRVAEVEAYARLHSTITFTPTCCEETPSAEDFVKQARAAGVCAARAFPVRHHYSLDPVACGDLLDLFSACFLPVIIPFPEVPGGWDGVYKLMRDFPRLTLILTETGCWGQDRYFRPLMRKYERFFVSTNRMETAGQLPSIVKKVGWKHIVFGTGLPWNNPGAYVTMVSRADIAEEAREAIAYGNLERIIGEISW